MLKALFSLFQVTESQFTAGALLRLRIAALTGLMALPLGIAKVLRDGKLMLAKTDSWIDIAFIVSIVAVLVVLLTRSVNRLFIPDGYLDEGEIARKREVNSYVLSTLMWVALTSIILLMILEGAGFNIRLSLNGLSEIFDVIMGFFIVLCCAQALKLTWVTKPINYAPDEVTAESAGQDYRYYGAAILFLAITIGVGFALGYYLSR